MDSFEFFGEAFPKPGRVSSLSPAVKESLINSLKYLLEVCEECIDPVQYQVAQKQLLKLLNAQGKLSGLLSVLHGELLVAAQNRDVSKVQRVVDLLTQGDFLREDVNFLNLSELEDFYKDSLEILVMKEKVEKADYYVIPPKEFEAVSQGIQKGLDALRVYYPDYYAELNDLLSDILILKSNDVRGGSSVDFFGMTYLSSTYKFQSELYKWESLFESLDYLIHESAHLYLHLLTFTDELVKNPQEMYVSPLRDERRPLMGTFHATFVLARIVNVLHDALFVKKIIPQNEIAGCEKSISYYTKRIHVGFDILEQHAQLTPLGQRLMETSKNLLPSF